ncbi:unnamed protein product [Adineta ricciae]|uniref:TUG ubiquitin-like domain-containing protein n=1 Tax=Adineta ricciae TaxID=249248 RepID=A0A815B0U1_ADIRI|nr:unnamed protein product [Adineta ricciae]CAF1264105.1 unnamed protein product [Adineta ricciae]
MACASSNRFDIQDEEANSAFLVGKRDVLLNNYQSACDHLSKACERIVQLRGNDTTPELAEPYFYYGQALLYLGLGEQQVFGSDIVKDEDNDENEGESEEDEDVDNVDGEEKLGEGVERKGDGEGEKADDLIPDDEQVNDLERAFEILECAHMIYSKMLETEPNDAHIITRLGDLHVMLADICNENGDHENALSNVLKAIDLQETISEQQRYRLLAESYYKLGLIYELINKFSEAVEAFDKAISTLRQAIEQATGEDKESEREELKSLLPAIELKRNDAQASMADKHLISQARSIVSGTNGNNHTTDNSTKDAPVKDITLSIRHKRPATESEKTDEENKKTKTEEKFVISMAKSMINILCPSGHRRKAQMAPNSNLLQVLEDMCSEENLDSSEWELIYQRHKCDLTMPWRLQSIPANATLEMRKLEDRRSTDDVNVQLQLPDNSRYSGWFEPTVTLQEMLDWYRIQPESMVAAIDISMSDIYNSCPVCTYMSEEVIGEYALTNTTLRDLGLTGGTAVIRYNLRPVSDSDLQKINRRIDDKIVRRRQQQYEQEQKSKQQQQQTSKTASARPSASTSSTTSAKAPPLPPSSNEEYSIFRDPPTRASESSTTTRPQQGQSRTLAEELGIDISLDPEPNKVREKSQSDFRDFKFPAATKGKNLNQNEGDDEYRHAQNVRPCDRRPIAYDTAKARSTRDKKDPRTGEALPESFYDVTAEDLRSMLSSLHQQSTEDAPLETRAMRERTQSDKYMVYDQIAIRLVVNPRCILQGLFRPEEPLSRLIDFAQTHLICPQIGQEGFYFYTTPPRVVLSDLHKPFSAYDLAPAAFVHLGHRTISPLPVQLVSNMSIRSIDEANQLAAQYVFSRARPMDERERERSTLYTERPSTADIATNATTRPKPRNPTASNIDDKQLRDKLRKFFPGKK